HPSGCRLFKGDVQRYGRGNQSSGAENLRNRGRNIQFGFSETVGRYFVRETENRRRQTKENQNRTIRHRRRSIELFGQRTRNRTTDTRMAPDGKTAKHVYYFV